MPAKLSPRSMSLNTPLNKLLTVAPGGLVLSSSTVGRLTLVFRGIGASFTGLTVMATVSVVVEKAEVLPLVEVSTLVPAVPEV